LESRVEVSPDSSQVLTRVRILEKFLNRVRRCWASLGGDRRQESEGLCFCEADDRIQVCSGNRATVEICCML